MSTEQLNYISTFSGYFPADSPKYSCIVVIREPDKSAGIMALMFQGRCLKKLPKNL